MHNSNVNPMNNAVTGPDFGMKLYKIEMKSDGGWVKLGGVFDGPTCDERIGQFQLHFMTRPNNGPQVCKRDFRSIEVDRYGNPV